MKLDNRIWLIVSILLMAALLAGGWFIGVQPQLAAQRTANEQRDEVRLTNERIRAEIDALILARDRLPELVAEAEAYELAVPVDTHAAAFIRQLSRIADETDVTIVTIRMADAVPYRSPGVPSPDEEETGAPYPHTEGLITSDNFIVGEIGVQVTGDWADVLRFVELLQTSERLVLVDGFSASLDSDGGTTASLSGSIYVLRDPSRPDPERPLEGGIVVDNPGEFVEGDAADE